MAIPKIPGFKTFGKPDVVVFRRAYGGSQTATVGLWQSVAAILLRKVRSKVDWNS